jgi:hypothetical protein
MSEVSIKIKNKTFKLKFGLKVFRILGEFWEVPTLMGVQQKIFSAFEGMTDNISFEQIDVINGIVIACVQANVENTETITKDELDDLFLEDTKAMLGIVAVVMKEFIKSLPQPEEAKTSGKPKAPTKGAKKNL